MSLKTQFARQAVKTTARHTAHGTASKLARRPFRSLTLLGVGATAGGVAGWLIGRAGGGRREPDADDHADRPRGGFRDTEAERLEPVPADRSD